MSRMIMSVVNVAMGGEKQGSGDGGSASLVSNRLYTDKEVITLLLSFQRTGFCLFVCFVFFEEIKDSAKIGRVVDPRRVMTYKRHIIDFRLPRNRRWK